MPLSHTHPTPIALHLNINNANTALLCSCQCGKWGTEKLNSVFQAAELVNIRNSISSGPISAFHQQLKLIGSCPGCLRLLGWSEILSIFWYSVLGVCLLPSFFPPPPFPRLFLFSSCKSLIRNKIHVSTRDSHTQADWVVSKVSQGDC